MIICWTPSEAESSGQHRLSLMEEPSPQITGEPKPEPAKPKPNSQNQRKQAEMAGASGSGQLTGLPAGELGSELGEEVGGATAA